MAVENPVRMNLKSSHYAQKYRTAPIKHLGIHTGKGSPEALSQMIQWPQELVSFAMEDLFDNQYSVDLSMFHSWLSVHKDTLKHVDIGELSGEGVGRLFKACDFPNLETLKLSRWQMGSSHYRSGRPLKFSSEDADYLLGSSLKHFSWVFVSRDRGPDGGWENFGEEEEEWLRAFANEAIARKSCLQEIFVDHDPKPKDVTPDSCYPWDLIDLIRDEVEPHGLKISYRRPAISREVWYDLLEEMEFDAAADLELEDAEDEMDEFYEQMDREAELVMMMQAMYERGVSDTLQNGATYREMGLW